MTAEFARQFRPLREARFPVRTILAGIVYFDNSFLGHVERGDRNISPDTAEQLAEALCLPLDERPLFFLRGAGFSEERISTALDSPRGVYVTTNSRLGEQITAGTLLKKYISNGYYYNDNNSKLARAAYVIPSTIWRVKYGDRFLKAPSAERLLKALGTPPEKQAEFLLLVIGHRPEVVHQVLTALKDATQCAGDLGEGEALVLQR